MIKPLLFAILAILSVTALAEEKEILLIRQDSVFNLGGQVYTILNHATSEYDGRKLSEKGTADLIALSKKLSIPIVATKHNDAFIDEFENEKQYYIKSSKPYRVAEGPEGLRVKSVDADYLLHSDGGQHRLQLPNAKLVIMGGGNLRACLCETMRDVVSGFGEIKEDKKIVLVREATYDYDIFNENVPETEAQFVGFVDKMILPEFNCPYQNTNDSTPAKNVSQVQLKFYSNGKLLKTVDRENSTGSVSVHLIPQAMLPQHISDVTQ